MKRLLEFLKAHRGHCEGCQLSLLKAIAQLTNLKCGYNIPHQAVDGIASFMREICPNNDNMVGNYDEVKKLLTGLELPHRKIDIYPDGCMSFWKETDGLDRFSICNVGRYLRMSKEGRQIPCLLYTSPSPRDGLLSRMPSSA